MLIENVSCVLCGSNTYSNIIVTQDRLCHINGDFSLVRCNDCGLYYLNPRPTPEAIDIYYPLDYNSFQYKTLAQMPPLQRFTVQYGLRKRCRSVLSYKKQGYLLDVGCATGQFLAEMRRYPGWQVYGVEPNHIAANFARQAFGLDVHPGDLVSAAYADSYFDVVTLWDVLEHLHNPQETLIEIRRILKPDGYLILRTPTLDSWDAQIFGSYWAGLDTPRHLVVFSRHTLTRLLAQTGFRLHHLRTGGGSYFIVLLSLSFWLDEAVSNTNLRRAFMKIANNLAIRLITALPLTIADRLGRGSDMVVVACPKI